MRKKIAMLVAGAAMAFAGMAHAADYPEKPITIIVPYAPGGITDIVGRTVGDSLSRAIGQTVIIENAAGAGGTIGARKGADAKSDGYTLTLGTSATHGTNPSTYAHLPYDATKDFQPVALLATAPLIIIANPSVPAKSLGDLINYAKTNPGDVTYATTGAGGSVHLTTELFSMQTGIKMTHVPYKGSSPALADVVGGHVNIMFDNVPSAMPLITAGKVKALAVTGIERSTLAPDVKTVDELAVSGFDSASWIALYAPDGTPADVIDALNKAVNIALKDSKLLETFAHAGLSAQGGSAEHLTSYQAGEITKWAEVVKTIGYEPK